MITVEKIGRTQVLLRLC